MPGGSPVALYDKDGHAISASYPLSVDVVSGSVGVIGDVNIVSRSVEEYYYNAAYTVAVGADDVEFDLLAELVALGRSTDVPPAYLSLTSDIAITVKLNDTAFTAIPLPVASGLLFDHILRVSTLYFSHTGASSASGDATVTILAM